MKNLRIRQKDASENSSIPCHSAPKKPANITVLAEAPAGADLASQRSVRTTVS